ncbi:MAG: C2 domain-containing protein [Planctomycetota bacterium]
MAFRHKPLHWLWLGASSVVVVGGLGLLLFRGEREEPEHPPPARVETNRHYYVLLSVVEVKPRKADGDDWDADGSAPDLYYEIEWQGHTVYRSAKKRDTLVARWSTASVDVDLLRDAVSVDDSIKAARITARPGEKLRFSVYDDDFLGRDDLVGRWEVGVGTLRLGDQEWKAPGGGLVSAACRVVALDRVDLEVLTR